MEDPSVAAEKAYKKALESYGKAVRDFHVKGGAVEQWRKEEGLTEKQVEDRLKKVVDDSTIMMLRLNVGTDPSVHGYERAIKAIDEKTRETEKLVRNVVEGGPEYQKNLKEYLGIRKRAMEMEAKQAGKDPAEKETRDAIELELRREAERFKSRVSPLDPDHEELSAREVREERKALNNGIEKQELKDFQQAVEKDAIKKGAKPEEAKKAAEKARLEVEEALRKRGGDLSRDADAKGRLDLLHNAAQKVKGGGKPPPPASIPPEAMDPLRYKGIWKDKISADTPGLDSLVRETMTPMRGMARDALASLEVLSETDRHTPDTVADGRVAQRKPNTEGLT